MEPLFASVKTFWSQLIPPVKVLVTGVQDQHQLRRDGRHRFGHKVASPSLLGSTGKLRSATSLQQRKELRTTTVAKVRLRRFTIMWTLRVCIVPIRTRTCVVCTRARTWNRRSPVLRISKKLGISSKLMSGVCCHHLSTTNDQTGRLRLRAYFGNKQC